MLAPYYHSQSFIALIKEDSFRKEVSGFLAEYNAAITSMMRFQAAQKVYLFIPTTGTGWEKITRVTLWHPEVFSDLGKEGKFITGMIKHDVLWEVFLARNTGIRDQVIAVVESWETLRNHIEKYWKKGYDVTDLFTHEGKYYVVMSSGFSWHQTYYLGSSYPKEKIEQQLQNGKVITEVIQLGDEVLWIFSGNTGFTDQVAKFMPPFEEEVAKIKQELEDPKGLGGFRCSLIREVNGKIFMVMLKK